MLYPRSRGRSRHGRRSSWLVVLSLSAAALFVPGSAAPVLAADAVIPSPSSAPTPDVTPAPTPDLTPAPTPDATPTPTLDVTPAPTALPTEASILIVMVDDNGTADPADDIFLDGASFAVYLDDGDAAFEDGDDHLVFGPASTIDSTIDTDLLPPGRYWILEAVVPAGFIGTDPILLELNTDPTVTCIWDATGFVECVPNEGDVEGLSWTIAIVHNTPIVRSPSPSGGVGGATGTPGVPGITLPPTDMLTGSSAPAGDAWRLIVLGMAGLMAAVLLLTPNRHPSVRGDTPAS